MVVNSMQCTFQEAYSTSPLSQRDKVTEKPLVSRATFYKYRPTEFQHSPRRSDVCDYCIFGKTMSYRLRDAITTHRLNWEYRDIHDDPQPLHRKLETEKNLRLDVKEDLRKTVEALCEVKAHQDEAKAIQDQYKNILLTLVIPLL